MSCALYSACSSGGAGFRASESGMKARLRLSGLGVEIDLRPRNSGEREEGLRPGDLLGEQEEELEA